MITKGETLIRQAESDIADGLANGIAIFNQQPRRRRTVQRYSTPDFRGGSARKITSAAASRPTSNGPFRHLLLRVFREQTGDNRGLIGRGVSLVFPPKNNNTEPGGFEAIASPRQYWEAWLFAPGPVAQGISVRRRPKTALTTISVSSVQRSTKSMIAGVTSGKSARAACTPGRMLAGTGIAANRTGGAVFALAVRHCLKGRAAGVEAWCDGNAHPGR